MCEAEHVMVVHDFVLVEGPHVVVITQELHQEERVSQFGWGVLDLLDGLFNSGQEGVLGVY